MSTVAPWHGCWSANRKGGSAMRKVMESLMLLLARIRKVITRTTIGSQDAAEPSSLRSVRERLSDTTGRRGAYVGRVLQGAKPGELPRPKQPQSLLVAGRI